MLYIYRIYPYIPYHTVSYRIIPHIPYSRISVHVLCGSRYSSRGGVITGRGSSFYGFLQPRTSRASSTRYLCTTYRYIHEIHMIPYTHLTYLQIDFLRAAEPLIIYPTTKMTVNRACAEQGPPNSCFNHLLSFAKARAQRSSASLTRNQTT